MLIQLICRLLLYNIPSRTGVSLTLESILELAEIKNIVGIKDSSGDLNLLKALKEQAPDHFCLYSGDDSNYLETIKLGGDGVISVASHVAGLQMNQIYQLYQKGKVEEAEALNEKLKPLYKGLFCTTNPIPIKAILNQLGMEVGGLRLPLVEMDQFETLELFNELRGLLMNKHVKNICSVEWQMFFYMMLKDLKPYHQRIYFLGKCQGSQYPID